MDMNIWTVQGGSSLEGQVRVHGAKNAVLPIMAASVLTGCESRLLGCPALSDVDAAARILEHLGCRVRRDGDGIAIDSRDACRSDIPHALMREMRSSVIFLGAILGRFGQAKLSMPGGCELGPRPIDIHLDALRALGAEITEQGGSIDCRTAGLRGAVINLSMPSVGATENALLAACAAEGETVITNAAREPEIVDLCRYLRRLGADIHGDGTACVTVSGFRPAPQVEHRIMPDRIVASTLLCAVAAAGGEAEICGARSADLDTVTASLKQMGCRIACDGDRIRIAARRRLQAPRPVITRPFPGFPTDAQPLLMAACLKAEGTAVFVENIFENRFRHGEELRRLGAEIRTEGRVAVVTGVEELHGAPMTTTDLRGGAALVIAALSAQGQSVIHDAGHIARGYEALEKQLQALGARISRQEA